MSGLNLPITASAPTDLANSGDGARLFRELSTALQNQLSPVLVGVFSARPAAGVAGRRYFATDTTTVYEDTGSAWLQTYPAAVAAASGIVFGGDATLNRRLANELGTPGSFVGGVGAAATLHVFRTLPTGSADHPFQIRNDGLVRWGSGATSPDTDLFRSGVSALKTNGDFAVRNGSIVGAHNTAGALFGFSIDGANNMILGSTNGSGVTSLALRGATQISLQAGAGPAATVNTSGQVTATAFVVSSDARLKKNVETVDGGLEKALALRGVEFDWKDKKRGKARRIGFIAQEVDEVIPGAAVEEPDGTLTLNQTDVLPVLVEAVKELSAKLNAALARVALLEGGSA